MYSVVFQSMCMHLVESMILVHSQDEAKVCRACHGFWHRYGEHNFPFWQMSFIIKILLKNKWNFTKFYFRMCACRNVFHLVNEKKKEEEREWKGDSDGKYTRCQVVNEKCIACRSGVQCVPFAHLLLSCACIYVRMHRCALQAHNLCYSHILLFNFTLACH